MDFLPLFKQPLEDKTVELDVELKPLLEDVLDLLRRLWMRVTVFLLEGEEVV